MRNVAHRKRRLARSLVPDCSLLVETSAAAIARFDKEFGMPERRIGRYSQSSFGRHSVASQADLPFFPTENRAPHSAKCLAYCRARYVAVP